MLQNLDSQVVIWAAIAVLVLLGLTVTSSKMRRGMAFVSRAIFGIATIFAINLTLGGLGLAVGINFLTMAVAAFLGIPGIIMLYGLGFFM